MSINKGFTLTELLIAILIILPIVAMPNFLNLKGDNDDAVIDLTTTMDSAVNLVYAQAAVDGVENRKSDSVDKITTAYGYPSADEKGIKQALSTLEKDWQVVSVEHSEQGGVMNYTLQSEHYAADVSACYVSYQSALFKGDTPTINVTSCDSAS